MNNVTSSVGSNRFGRRAFLTTTLTAGISGSRAQEQLSVGAVNLAALSPNQIAVDDIDNLISNVVNGQIEMRRSRVIQFGQVLSEPETARVIERDGVVFDPVRQVITIAGHSSGQPVIEEIRFFRMDEKVYVVRDLYIEPTEEFIGRGIPVSLDDDSVEAPPSSKVQMRAAAQPNPLISSIDGVTNDSAGISNGKVSMSCGNMWNGGRVVNDQSKVYPWTINGSNFGSQRGQVTLGGQNVAIESWSTAKIVVQPIMGYNSGPVCTILSVITATGAKAVFGADIVPSIRSRIYGQCTWWAAFSRLNMSKQPSPYAYDGYSTIDGKWLPQRGDQLQWNRKHTAIIDSAQGPTSQGGINSWTLTITQYNAGCDTKFSSYPTTFAVRTSNGSVSSYPQSSVGFGSATLFYR